MHQTEGWNLFNYIMMEFVKGIRIVITIELMYGSRVGLFQLINQNVSRALFF